MIPGIVEGEALVCADSITGWGGIDPETGVIKDYENVNRGKCIKDTILIICLLYTSNRAVLCADRGSGR